MAEVWKPVVGYVGQYEVSNMGNVRSVDRIDNYGRHKTGKMLKPIVHRDGYLQVALSKYCKPKRKGIHNLVMEAFIGVRPQGYEVNHIDEDKTNNKLENLEYVTHQQNVQHGFGNKKRSESNTNNPLISKGVMQFDGDRCIAIFPSQAEAKRQTGISQTHISMCCLGKRKKAGGYTWKFAKVYANE